MNSVLAPSIALHVCIRTDIDSVEGLLSQQLSCAGEKRLERWILQRVSYAKDSETAHTWFIYKLCCAGQTGSSVRRLIHALMSTPTKA